jgi:hypothetical protein
LATFALVNAANVRRGYLSGKILVLIINELCFAKQYLSGAPGDFSGETGELAGAKQHWHMRSKKNPPYFYEGLN